jgi:hypothetical protein
MLINDVKKGIKLKLKDGREAIMMDNAKGTIRMIKTQLIGMQGDEIGSIYSDQISEAFVNGEWVSVEFTPAQEKQLSKIHSYGF